MGCFKIVLDKLKKDVQKKMGNLSAAKGSNEKFEKLSEKSSDKTSKDFRVPIWFEDCNNPRVAMDFTYGTGRVVNDPIEAAEIARSEGRGGSGIHRPTRFQPLVPIPPDALNFGLHLTQSYYHGNSIGRERAEALVTEAGKTGTFLVRDSVNRPGSLVITYFYGNKAHHQYITPVFLPSSGPGEGIYLATCDRDTVFYDAHSLIEYHRLNKGALQTILTESIKNITQPDSTPLRHRRHLEPQPGPSREGPSDFPSSSSSWDRRSSTTPRREGSHEQSFSSNGSPRGASCDT